MWSPPGMPWSVLSRKENWRYWPNWKTNNKPSFYWATPMRCIWLRSQNPYKRFRIWVWTLFLSRSFYRTKLANANRILKRLYGSVSKWVLHQKTCCLSTTVRSTSKALKRLAYKPIFIRTKPIFTRFFLDTTPRANRLLLLDVKMRCACCRRHL